jgi:hypothetical protein
MGKCSICRPTGVMVNETPTGMASSCISWRSDDITAGERQGSKVSRAQTTSTPTGTGVLTTEPFGLIEIVKLERLLTPGHELQQGRGQVGPLNLGTRLLRPHLVVEFGVESVTYAGGLPKGKRTYTMSAK